MWWKAGAISLAVLINAVAFLAVYFASADNSVSRFGALPEHLPRDGGAGNRQLARAAKFPLQKHEAQSRGTWKPMCKSCKMAPSLIRIIKTLVSPLKYIVGLMSGAYNSKCRYNVIFCHVQCLQVVRWAAWFAGPAIAYGWDNKRRFRVISAIHHIATSFCFFSALMWFGSCCLGVLGWGAGLSCKAVAMEQCIPGTAELVLAMRACRCVGHAGRGVLVRLWKFSLIITNLILFGSLNSILEMGSGYGTLRNSWTCNSQKLPARGTKTVPGWGCR